jgi:hypothetical protein
VVQILFVDIEWGENPEFLMFRAFGKQRMGDNLVFLVLMGVQALSIYNKWEITSFQIPLDKNGCRVFRSCINKGE